MAWRGMVGEFVDRSAGTADVFQDRGAPIAVLPAYQLFAKHP